MTVVDSPKIAFAEIKPKIGSVVHADKATLLNGDYASEIRERLEQRGVLVFPEINFDDEEQIAFTSTLGHFAKELRGEDIYKITLDKSQNATADYLKGAFFWHFDGYVAPTPILASLLSSKVLAFSGGNTEFCNTYAAYEALCDDDKKLVENLCAVHSVVSTMLYYDPEPSYEKFCEMRKLGRKELPLVWTHKSGRKSLVIGNSAHNILGMDPLDGTDLLVRLRDFATCPEFTYSHEWKVGDLVMWDNTGTLHRAMPYPLDCGRMLHRTKLEGEQPIA